MIDHKEVRIGNTLKSSDSIKLINVFHIDEDDDRGRINYIGANNYEPVELTPDILEAAGFKRLQNRNRYSKDELTNDIVFSNGFYISNVTPEIKYLHQLQNLYFALTGDELQIDITKLNK